MDKPLFDMKTRLSYNGVPDPFHYVLRLRINFLRKVSFILYKTMNHVMQLYQTMNHVMQLVM